MLIRVKDTPVGEVHPIKSVFQASVLNWKTGERVYLGDFQSFSAAKRSILARHKKVQWQS